ncbi:O-methyltransferase [Consotaella aegiceratis]|uniref:O-methyltransferase n=1 Tax=Consotaella aegiceratis TaxID=3097961 RepID=UPI002F3E2912
MSAVHRPFRRASRIAACAPSRHRAIAPDAAQMIALIVKSLEHPTILEIGTSYGYSGIWLAEAARATGGRLITMEQHDYKSAFAHDMAVKAGLADWVEFKVGDAVQMIAEMEDGVDFVLLDLWKDLYVPCLHAFYPKLKSGAIVAADNMLRPGGENLRRYSEAVRAKPGMTSVLLPVGTGLEISRLEPN